MSQVVRRRSMRNKEQRKRVTTYTSSKLSPFNGIVWRSPLPLRRRASSLDFLPEAVQNGISLHNVSKSVSPNQLKGHSPFSRTTSLSQRSPFRRRMAFTDSDTSMSGFKEGRPRSLKRSKSGLDALFEAIDRQDLEEVQRLVEAAEVNINDLNSDKFTPLDVALMKGEADISIFLLNHGAIENPEFSTPDNRSDHLNSLIEEAEGKVNDFTTNFANSVGDVKDNERHLREWEYRCYLLRVMQSGFHSADCPIEAPQISVAPLSNQSVMAMITPTSGEENRDLVTKYKVEWSRDEDFSIIEGSRLLTDRRQLTCTIDNLEKNVNWYVRVRSGNLKGFGPFGYPDPAAVVPSSWHECDDSVARYYGASDTLRELIDELYSFQKQTNGKVTDESSDEEISANGQSPQSPKSGSKNSMMRSLSKYTNLIFNSAPKLLKKIKSRGIYLAALLYSEDGSRVMVTMDENLPVVEVDDNYSKSFNQEFYWFAKASCTWEDIQHMLFYSTKSNSSPSVMIRRKLLQSALVLQNATGVTDLGPVHYKPFKDNHGSILLLSVNCVKKHSHNMRSVTMKWLPIQKLLKRSNSASNDQILVPERLIPSVQEQVHIHKRSRTPLSRGLYIGYLKLRTSMDTLSVMVPNSHTSVLPFVKIRDIPNVTKEEWKFIKNLQIDQTYNEGDNSPLAVFEQKLKLAVSKLCCQIGTSEESFLEHRIYDREVIELNSDVLFLLLIPPKDQLCTMPQQTDFFTNHSGYTAQPVQAFEMSNMMTYQPELMTAYSRLSSIIEMETLSTQQVLRESLSHNESKFLRDRQNRLEDIQHRVDECWKNSRWVFDTIQLCQERTSNVGIPLSALFKTTEFEKADFRKSRNLDLDRDLSVYSSHSNCHSSLSISSSCSSSSSVNSNNSCVKIYGTAELGLPCDACAEINVNSQSTTQDVIQLTASYFLKQYNDVPYVRDKLSAGSLKHLALVSVSGSKEKCLRNDTKILSVSSERNSLTTDRGTLYLRTRKEAVRTSKLSTSTPV